MVPEAYRLLISLQIFDVCCILCFDEDIIQGYDCLLGGLFHHLQNILLRENEVLDAEFLAAVCNFKNHIFILALGRVQTLVNK